MGGALQFHFDVDGDNFISAGEASVEVKRKLRQLGFSPEVIRCVSMVIHARGGEADVTVYRDRIELVLTDHGPGIADIALAMQEGYSTAPDTTPPMICFCRTT